MFISFARACRPHEDQKIRRKGKIVSKLTNFIQRKKNDCLDLDDINTEYYVIRVIRP